MEYIPNPERVTYFAKTDARNKMIPFGIKAKDRTRHVYIIGKTGMGKSTCLENMAVQDIKNGEGFCFVDPHGKSAELLLDYIPKDRVEDVLYFAPFDLDHPISFNVMEDVGYDKRHLVVSGLMSAFKKIWVEAWSARMEYILTNTLLALLEYPDATILGVNRMYTDKNYRKKVVENVKDPLVRSFWVDEFATYTDRYTQEATPAIQNKIGQFTGNPLIRNIVGQSKSTFDLRDIIDRRKILIVNLSKGKVGEVNANLLGSMFITKIYLAAMSRADISQGALEQLPNFYFYVDEFQSFANESFADILSEARKYKLNLTMAHQYIEQMSEEVRNAVFGNVGTMITFRVGAYDAEVLEKEFMPQFTAQDLVNLGFAQIYLKLMIDGIGSKPFSAETLPPITQPEISLKEDVIACSRKTFGRPRRDIEDLIREEHTSTRQIEMTEKKEKMQKEWQERRTDWTRDEKHKEVSAASLPRHEEPRVPAKESREREERREFRAPRPPVQNQQEHQNESSSFRRRDAAPVVRGEVPPYGREHRENREERMPDRRVPEERRAQTKSQRRPQNTGESPRVPPSPVLAKNKEPSEKNVSSLKEALARVLKETPLRQPEATAEDKTLRQVLPEKEKIQDANSPRDAAYEEKSFPPPLSTVPEIKKEKPSELPRNPKEISRNVLENILREDESNDEEM